jgi:nitrous oxidase accessory protein NosD
MAYPGETPILDGDGRFPTTSWHDGLIAADSRSYIHLHGITVRNSRYLGVHFYKCHHIKITNCTVHNTRDGGIIFNGAAEGGTDVLVDNCEVHHTNQEGSAAMHEAVTIRAIDGFEVKNVRVHDCEEEGIDAKYQSTNGSIHHCRSYNNGTGIYIDKANTIDIYNNTLYNNGPGLLRGIEEEGDTPEPYKLFQVKAYNNLIYNNDTGIAFWVEDPVVSKARYHDVLIVNNLIYKNNLPRTTWRKLGMKILPLDSNFGDNIVVRNNIFWKNEDDAISFYNADPSAFIIDHNLFDTEDTGVHGSDAVTTSDVLFVDEAAGDFRLQSGSPAGGQGSSDGAPAVDFDGTSRSAPHGIGPFVAP